MTPGRYARLRRASSSRPSSASPRSTGRPMVERRHVLGRRRARATRQRRRRAARIRTSRPSAASCARGCGFRCPRSSSAPARSASWARACTSCRATRRSRCRKASTAGGCRRSPCADPRRSCWAPSEVDLTVYSVDVLASKAFGIGGTARLEPFVGGACCSSTRAAASSTPRPRATRCRGGPGGQPTTNAQCAASQAPGGRRRPERQLHVPGTGRHHPAALRWRLQAEAGGPVHGRPGRHFRPVAAAGTAHAWTARPTAAAPQQTYSLAAGFDF